MSSTNIDPGITETAQTIGNRAVNGSVSVSRNANVGGDATVEGSAVIGHNLRVEGWLEAKNIKGPNKGMFVSADRLREMYPRPMPGWWALCGLSLPAPLYIADYTTSGIEWVNTGTTAGNPTVACEVYNEAVKLLDEATKANAAEISKNRKAINDIHDEIVAICRSVIRMEDEHKEMKELVEGFDSRVTKAQNTAEAAMPPTITLGELDTLGTDGELMSMYGLLRDKPHTRYRVVTTYGNETFTVGVLDVYMDSMRHVITEVLTTHYILDEASGLLSSAHKDDSLYFYYRAYNIDSSSLTASGVAKKTWSSWCEYSDELREMLSDSVELLNEVRDDLFLEISDRKAGDEACRGYTDDCSQSLDRKIDTVQALLEKDMQDLHDEMVQSDEAVEQRLGKRIDGALELIADCADAEITDGKFRAANERLDNLSQEHEGDVNSLDRKIDTVQAVLEKDIADGDEAVRTELTSKINSLRGSSSASSRDISRLEVWPFEKVIAEGDDIVKNSVAVRIKYGLSFGDIVYSEQYRGFAVCTVNGFSADWGNEISLASDAVGDQVLTGGGSAGSGGSVTETVKFTEAEFYGDVFPGVGERTCRRPARKSLYRLTDDNSLWLWDGSALRKVSDIELLTELKNSFETLIGNGNVSEVIDTFNEIEAFLQGITNSETLTGLLQDLKATVLNEVTANYLKLTGGVIKDGSNTTPLVIDTTDNFNIYFPFRLRGKQVGYVGYVDGTVTLKNSSGCHLRIWDANSPVNPGAITFKDNIIWHEGNDGSGSGLDADLLDGYNTTSSGKRWGVIPTISQTGVMEVGKYIDFHTSATSTDDYCARLSVSDDNNTLSFNGSKIWTANNDGADSGLDADLLDGKQASYFVPRDDLTPIKDYVGMNSRPPQQFINEFIAASKSNTIPCRLNGEIRSLVDEQTYAATFNYNTNCFEWGGLDDISYEEALKMLPHVGVKEAHSSNIYQNLRGCNSRAFVIHGGYFTIYDNPVVESVVLLPEEGNSGPHNTYLQTPDDTFRNCPNLRKISGIITFVFEHGDITGSYTLNFGSCINLEEVAIKITANYETQQISVWLGSSPKLSFDSVSYLINNKSGSAQVTLRIHPTVYAKIMGDMTNVDVAKLTATEVQAWMGLLSLAASKNITISTN